MRDRIASKPDMRVLISHFFGRFFDKESLSPQGEPEANVVQLLGILAVPGAFLIIVLQSLSLRGWALVTFRYYFVSFSMIVLGFLVLFEWDMLFPDRRDHQILTPLPLSVTRLFLAKVAALGLFLGLFLLDINFFGTLLWPGVDGGKDLLPILGAHLAAVGAGGLFAALAAASIQGLLVLVLGGKVLRRVSTAIQTLLMGLLVMALFLTPALATGMPWLMKQNHPFLYYFPGYWFVGLYELLRPATRNPALAALGWTGLQALGCAAALFLLTYMTGYRRHVRKVLEAPAPNPAGPGPLRRLLNRTLNGAVLKQPVERAVFHFIGSTIARSMKHRIFLATYAGFGAALAVGSFAPGSDGRLRLPLTLSFVLVSGLRAAFNVPSELSANWAFQTSDSNQVRACLSATRKWVVACGIVPLFVLLAPMEFICFAWPVALFHAAFGITLSLLLVELLFFGFRKVPFACSYFPGKINLTGLIPIYILGFTTYSDTMAGVESWLVSFPAAILLFFAVAGIVYGLLRYARERQLGGKAEIAYEDAGDPLVRTLGLTPE